VVSNREALGAVVEHMATRPSEVLAFVLRSSKRIAVFVIGAAFVCAGLALLVLPGPGIIVVAVGFAILGTEYAWAAIALDRTKSAASEAGRAARGTARSAGRTANRAMRGVSGRVLRR
jgi:hypothetical protein